MKTITSVMRGLSKLCKDISCFIDYINYLGFFFFFFWYNCFPLRVSSKLHERLTQQLPNLVACTPKAGRRNGVVIWKLSKVILKFTVG